LLSNVPDIVSFRDTFFLLVAIVSFSAVVGCNGSPDGVATENTYGQDISRLGGEVQIHLEFGRTAITDEDLAKVEFPDTVRSISLHHTEITDKGVAELKRASRLETIDLSNTKITDAAVQVLMEMPHLWQAEVLSPGVSPETSLELKRFLQPRVRDRLEKLYSGT